MPRSVAGNNLKGSGAAFGEALKSNSSLKELKMVECGLGAEDLKGLAGGLAVHGSLTELNMLYNNLDSDGKEALQDAVRSKEGFRLLV